MTREQLARIAMRYDTAMSRAMLRALGVELPTTHAPTVKLPKMDRHRGARGLMAQRYGVQL